MYCPGVPPDLGYLPQYKTIAQWRPGAAHRALSLLFSLLLSLIDHRIEPTLRSSHHHLLVHLNPAASPSLPSLLSLLLLTSAPPTSPHFLFEVGIPRGEEGEEGSIHCVGVIFFFGLLLLLLLLLQVPLMRSAPVPPVPTSILDAAPDINFFPPSPRARNARTAQPRQCVSYMLTTCIY